MKKILGDDEALSEVEHLMRSPYTIKVRAVLGAGCDDAKEVRNRNRYVRWSSDGERSWIEYEPDPRHAELIVKLLNLESAKGVTTPSVKKRLEEVLMTSPQLDALQTRQYRCVVMRAAYLSHDRPDLSYSPKEFAREMQKPTEQSMTNLKRLGRNLKKRPRLVQLFIEQTSTASVVRLDVHGDSDHARCLKTRHSVVGEASIMELSNAQPLASTRTWSPPARADSLLLGAATSTRRRFSLEEGAGRHERERRAHQNSGRVTHDETVGNDGLRVQRRAHSIGARVSMTIKIVFSITFQHEFFLWYSGAGWSRSARSGRVLGGGKQIFVKTLTSKSGIWNSRRQATS